MKAMIAVKTVRRPYSQAALGVRLVAAIPNMAGKMFGEVVPSFRKPYFIAESGDTNVVTEGMRERFLAQLKWLGFDEIEEV